MNLTQSLKESLNQFARGLSLTIVVAAVLVSTGAHAAVTQPNGLQVPLVNMDEDNYAVTLPPAGRHVTLPLFFTARAAMWWLL